METHIATAHHHARNRALDYAVWPGWRVLMEDAGLRTAPVLRRAGLPGDLFARPQVRLDPQQFFQLWQALEAEALSLDPDLPAPLRIARVMTADWFDPELFAALCSPDLGSALGRIATYVRLIAPMQFHVERGSRQSRLTIDFLGGVMAAPTVFLAFKLIFFVGLARLATRSPVRPLQVGLPVPPTGADASLYEEFFGATIQPAPLATLVFSNEDMDRPFLTENHKMWQVFEPGLRQRLADLDCTAGMAERVRSLLLELLPAGVVSMGEVSRKLAVSTRTLQRKLHEEGTTFQRTLDAVRDALAHHYLGSTAMSAAEISFLLGFEDANSFARAFQGWTGHTPQTVRNRLQEAAATFAASMRSK